MANNQIGGSFEMFEAEAALGGGRPVTTRQAQNNLGNGFLPLDQVIIAPQMAAVEQQPSHAYLRPATPEVAKIGHNTELGTDGKVEIVFNDRKMELLNKLMGENAEEFNKATEKAEEAAKVEEAPKLTENKITEKAKSLSQITAKKTIETTLTAAKDLYKETKEFISAVGSLFKDYIIFKLETKEQKAAREKSEAKKKEKAMTLKATIAEFKAALSNFLMKKQKDSQEEQQRLEIIGMGVAERNQVMGPTRNLSDTDIDTKYHNYETYVGMVRAREEQKRKENEIKMQQTQSVDRSQIKFATEMSGSQHVLNTAG